MNETGPARPSLSERLKARSAEDLREVEAAIRAEHERLAENLRQSSHDALSKIEKSIAVPIMEIERRITGSRNKMMSALAEIEINPVRTMRNTAILSAGIGALIATLPWVAMNYLGMSVIGETRVLQETKDALTAEIAASETRAAVLEKVWVADLNEGKFLMVPNAEEKLFTCGSPPIPCVRLKE